MAPPRPKLVLRIGVTGHRPNRFSEGAQSVVSQKIERLLLGIGNAANELHRREAAFFDPAAVEIRIVSALAEGADRIVAEAGVKAGFLLDVILPFPADIYSTDFESEESRAAFRGLLGQAHACFTLPGERSKTDPAIANRAYEAAGLMTLRQCDLLLAIWDGQNASGRGGTGAIVQSAIINGQPVLRFDDEGNGPWLLAPAETLPSDARDIALRAAKGSPAQTDTIVAIVERLCRPPGGAAEDKSAPGNRARRELRRFLQEKQRPFLFGAFGYPLILSLLSSKKGFWKSFKRRPYVAGAEDDWQPYWDSLKDLPTPMRDSIREVILRRFGWADGLADHFGQLHRSSYFNNFALAALAVLFASLPASWSPWCELGVILLIAINTTMAVFGQWHRRWLDYRQLSGLLRSLRSLVLTASSTSEARSPRTSEQPQSGSVWVNWYCRLAAREVQLPNFAVDRTYVAMARDAICRGELDDQIAYHRTNAARMGSVAHWLAALGHVAFAITFLVCGYEAAVEYWPQLTVPWVWHDLPRTLSIVLPAFGAALFGIRIHGEFKSSAERSAAMLRQLETLALQCRVTEQMSFAELSALNEHAATIMASEIGDWSFVYRARPLALPA